MIPGEYAKEGTMFDYPITITPDDNGMVMLTVLDVPEVTTFGEDEAEAISHAADALETALTAYTADRRDIPAASPARGSRTVAPSLLGSLKLAIYVAMRARGWRKADLARGMGLNPRQIDRLLDLRHASTVGQLDQALAVCGQRASIETVALAAA